MDRKVVIPEYKGQPLPWGWTAKAGAFPDEVRCVPRPIITKPLLEPQLDLPPPRTELKGQVLHTCQEHQGHQAHPYAELYSGSRQGLPGQAHRKQVADGSCRVH